MDYPYLRKDYSKSIIATQFITIIDKIMPIWDHNREVFELLKNSLPLINYNTLDTVRYCANYHIKESASMHIPYSGFFENILIVNYKDESSIREPKIMQFSFDLENGIFYNMHDSSIFELKKLLLKEWHKTVEDTEKLFITLNIEEMINYFSKFERMCTHSLFIRSRSISCLSIPSDIEKNDFIYGNLHPKEICDEVIRIHSNRIKIWDKKLYENQLEDHGIITKEGIMNFLKYKRLPDQGIDIDFTDDFIKKTIEKIKKYNEFDLTKKYKLYLIDNIKESQPYLKNLDIVIKDKKYLFICKHSDDYYTPTSYMFTIQINEPGIVNAFFDFIMNEVAINAMSQEETDIYLKKLISEL